MFLVTTKFEVHKQCLGGSAPERPSRGYSLQTVAFEENLYTSRKLSSTRRHSFWV